MRKIRFIIRKEFQQIRRDRAMLAIIFVLPVIQLILMGYVISSEVQNISMVVCDLDNSSVSREMINRFTTSGYFHINYYEKNQDKLLDYLDRGKVTGAIVFPQDFHENIVNGQPASIQLLLDGQDFNGATITLGYINGILQQFSTENLEKQMTNLKLAGINPKLIQVETRVWYNPNLEYSDYMVPGIAVFLLTMVTALLSAMGLVREREIGTLEQLVVTPITKYQLLIGKILPFAILGILEFAIALGFAKLWYHIPMNGNLALFSVFAVVYLFTSLGVGLFVSATAQTQQQALFMAWFFMVFLFLMSGFVFPIENMPQIAQYLTYINPMRYMIIVIREVFIKGAQFHHIMWQGAAMAAFSLTLFLISVRKFQSRVK